MFCEKCGAEIANGAGFCESCGALVAGGEIAKQKKQARLKVVMIALAAVLVLVVGILIVVINLPEKKKVLEEQTGEVVSENTVEETAIEESVKEGRDDIDAAEEDYEKYASLSLYDYRNDQIDIYAETCQPGEKDSSLSWDNTLFNRLDESGENQIATYRVEKKYYTDKGQHEVCLLIYKQPETDVINRITTIEYLEGYERRTNYYYLDDGHVNTIHISYSSVTSPELQALTNTNYSLFFGNDTMLQYYVYEIGGAYNNIQLSVAEGSSATCYYEASDEVRAHYDMEEKKMLSAAHNVMQAAGMDYSYGSLCGLVTDHNHNFVTDVKVEIYVSGTNYKVGEIKSEEGGIYSTGISWNEEAYDLVFSKEGYVGSVLYNVVISPEHGVVLCDTTMLINETEGMLPVTIVAYDDTDVYIDENNNPATKIIANATAQVRVGKNNIAGKVYTTTRASEDGSIVAELPAGTYTLAIEADNYNTVYKNIEVSAEKILAVPMTQLLSGNSMKIVVCWEEKADIDISMLCETADMGMTFLWQGAATDGVGDRFLYDGKDVLRSEVIYLDNYRNGKYRFYVTDYANCVAGNMGDALMSGLNLVVYAYDASGLVAYYEMPYSAGTVWEVFSIEEGTIRPVQNVYTEYTPNGVWGVKVTQ